MGSDLGFGDAPKKILDLTDFKPRTDTDPARPTPEQEAAVDRAAERVGFTTREPTERVMRERKSKEPSDQCFVRAPISVMNRFKHYCNETGQSYGEALEALMRKAGI